MAQRPRRFYFGLLALLCLIVAAYSVFTWEMVDLPWLHGAKGQDLAHLRRHNESSGHGIATATGADNVTRLPNATLKLHATGPVDVMREPSSSPVLHTTKGIDATTATPPYDLFGDVVHLNNLNEACFHANDSIVHSSYNSTEVDLAQLWTRDKTPQNELIAHLAQCPEVDIFLPAGLRDHGYCEDGMAYVKFLKTRALPLWVFDLRFDYQGRKNINYFDLCPNTALLFMNHYTEGLMDRDDFPSDKVIVNMPNVEMYELKEKDYHRFDVVLCKTRDGYDRLSRWYKDNGNPRNTKLLYVQHTSSDPSTVAITHAMAHPELPPIQPKNFDQLTFFHANGHSWFKSTRAVLECWQQRPDFPLIHVYSRNSWTLDDYHQIFGGRSPSNLQFHHGEEVDVAQFGRQLLETSAILCPSRMEGFGHYINQARASGSLVLTTNAPPMNEFIDGDSGVLVDAFQQGPNRDQLLSAYGGMEWTVSWNSICDAVDNVLHLAPSERQRRAQNGRRRYEKQLTEFRDNMHDVRALLAKKPQQ